MSVTNPIITYLRVTFGAALLVGLVWYFGATEIIAPLARADVKWICIVVTLIVVATLISAWNRYTLIYPERELTFSRFLSVYWASWALGLFVPGQVGDVAALSVLLRQHGMDWHASLGRSLLDKLISFAVVFSLGTWGLLTLVLPNSGAREGALLLMIAGLIALPILLRRLSLVRSYPGQAIAKTGIRAIIAGIAHELVATSVKYPRKLAGNFLLSIVSTLLIGLSYWGMFNALGYAKLSFQSIVPLVSASSMVAYLPISFNGLGVVEISGVWLFTQVGVAAQDILSAYICLRILVITIAWAPTALILLLARSGMRANQPE